MFTKRYFHWNWKSTGLETYVILFFKSVRQTLKVCYSAYNGFGEVKVTHTKEKANKNSFGWLAAELLTASFACSYAPQNELSVMTNHDYAIWVETA